MTDLEPRDIQQYLTKREYDAIIRFGIGPPETPTPKQRIVFNKAKAKIRAEQRRADKAKKAFYVECAGVFDSVADTETDSKKRRELRRKARKFREAAKAK